MGFLQLQSRPPDVIPPPTGTVSGTWSVPDAAGTASWIGTALLAAVLSCSGASTPSYVGASTAASALSSAGSGTAAWSSLTYGTGALSVPDAQGTAPWVGVS